MFCILIYDHLGYTYFHAYKISIGHSLYVANSITCNITKSVRLINTLSIHRKQILNHVCTQTVSTPSVCGEREYTLCYQIYEVSCKSHSLIYKQVYIPTGY